MNAQTRLTIINEPVNGKQYHAYVLLIQLKEEATVTLHLLLLLLFFVVDKTQ
jgi:hypothetical protein